MNHKKLNLYIVRHGKTIMNTLDRVQGWCDSPLTEEGIEKAKTLGKGLKHIPFRSAYCSDLRRTKQTVKNILESQPDSSIIPITEMEGLREACFGSFEADFNYTMWGNAGLYLGYLSPEAMYEDILKKKLSYGDVLDVIKKMDKMGLAEGFSEVEKRTQESLFEIIEQEKIKNDSECESNILIVAHGMSILCMLYNIGGKELLKSHLDNVSVCKAVFDNNTLSILTMGDMSYLQKGDTEK